MSGNKVGQVERFKYLESILQMDAVFEKYMKNNKIKCEWTKWREVSVILYDKRIKTRLNKQTVRYTH